MATGDDGTSLNALALDETEARVVELRLQGKSYREIQQATGVPFVTAWAIAQRPHVRAKIDELAAVAVKAAQETLTTRMPELLDTAIGIADGTIEATPARARMVLELLARGGLVAVERVEVSGGLGLGTKSDEELAEIVRKAGA